MVCYYLRVNSVDRMNSAKNLSRSLSTLSKPVFKHVLQADLTETSAELSSKQSKGRISQSLRRSRATGLARSFTVHPGLSILVRTPRRFLSTIFYTELRLANEEPGVMSPGDCFTIEVRCLQTLALLPRGLTVSIAAMHCQRLKSGPYDVPRRLDSIVNSESIIFRH